MVISSHDTDFVLFRFQHHKGYSVSMITGTHWSWIQFPFPFLYWFQPVCMSSNDILIKRPKISHWARLRYILIFEANHCFRTPPESELTYALNLISKIQWHRNGTILIHHWIKDAYNISNFEPIPLSNCYTRYVDIRTSTKWMILGFVIKWTTRLLSFRIYKVSQLV